MEIKKLSKKDENQLLFFIKKEDKSFPEPLSSRVDLKEYVNKLLNNAIIYAVEDMNTYAGVICYYKNDYNSKVAYLTYLCVNNDYRKRKIGQKLIDIMINDCKHDKFNKIILETSKDNVIAQKFYEKNGFFCVKEDNKSIFYEKNLNVIIN